MKKVKNRKFNTDPLAQIKKSKNYNLYAKESDERIRLAAAVYNKRVGWGWSQQKLAKLANTTQKVISNIENADMNPGLNLLNRIGESLHFRLEDWASVHKFGVYTNIYFVGSSGTSQNNNGNMNKLNNILTSNVSKSN
jgi:transcriptional regulator with XRE-family HTH domain